jgi:phosphodiesterase/alkaline phosphatase D-like protein
MQHAGIRNKVWITADLHYTAAHFFDPNKAIFQDFEPFWEFVFTREPGLRARSTARSAQRSYFRAPRVASKGTISHLVSVCSFLDT